MTTYTTRRDFHGWLTKRLSLRKQRTRRLLVISLLGCYLLLFTLGVLQLLGPADSRLQIDGWLAALLVIIVAVPSGGLWLIDRFMKKERMTGPSADERQIELYHRAVLTAYQWLTTAIMVVSAACLFYLFVNLTNRPAPTIRVGFDGLLWFWLLAPELIRNLPKALVLWREGDLLEETEEWTTPDPLRLQQES